MAVLHITNKEPDTKVWLDARFSSGGIPFNELSMVPGFPRWIDSGETISIEMFDWNELLFRRSMHMNEGLYHESFLGNFLSPLHRIGMSGRKEVKGYIWPLPIFPGPKKDILPESQASLTELRKSHWLIAEDNYIFSFVREKCGAEDIDLKIARNELLRGEVKTLILLKSKVRVLKNLLIEPFIKASGYSLSAMQVFVKLTSLLTNQSCMKMIIETDPTEALSLIDSFVIEKGELVAMPRTTKYGSSFAKKYRSRGFRVPVTVPIIEIQNVD